MLNLSVCDFYKILGSKILTTYSEQLPFHSCIYIKKTCNPSEKEKKILNIKVINTPWITEVGDSQSSLSYNIFSSFIIHEPQINILVLEF